MMNRIIGATRRGITLTISAGMVLVFAGHVPVLADEDAPKSVVTSLIKQSLTADLEGRFVIIVSVDYPPGGASGPHRHPAEVFGYIEEGAITIQIEDGDPITYTAGQVFYEPPMVLHKLSKNASDTDTAKAIAFVLIEDGKPVVIPEE